MQRRPLADHLSPHSRIVDLLGRRAGAGIGGNVAHAVAGGLDGVQIDLGQGGEDIRRIAKLDPVELQIGAGGEVAVSFVIGLGHPGQPPQLARR